MSVASSTTKATSKVAVAAGVAGAAALAGITYAFLEAAQEESTNTEEIAAAAPSEEEESQQQLDQFALALQGGSTEDLDTAATVLAELLTIDDEDGTNVVKQFVTDSHNAGHFGTTNETDELVISVDAVTNAIGLSDPALLDLLDDVETLFGIEQSEDAAVNASGEELGPHYKVLDIVELAQSQHVDADVGQDGVELSLSQEYIVDTAYSIVQAFYTSEQVTNLVKEYFGESENGYYTMAELAAGIRGLEDYQRSALGLA